MEHPIIILLRNSLSEERFMGEAERIVLHNTSEG